MGTQVEEEVVPRYHTSALKIKHNFWSMSEVWPKSSMQTSQEL